MTTNQTTEGHFSLQTLSDHIVGLSVANTLSAAAIEWKVTDGYLAEDWEHCACGQSIRHVCVITNSTTNESTEVGSTCVKRFLGLDVASAFKESASIVQNYTIKPTLLLSPRKTGFTAKPTPLKSLPNGQTSLLQNVQL